MQGFHPQGYPPQPSAPPPPGQPAAAAAAAGPGGWNCLKCNYGNPTGTQVCGQCRRIAGTWACRACCEFFDPGVEYCPQCRNTARDPAAVELARRMGTLQAGAGVYHGGGGGAPATYSGGGGGAPMQAPAGPASYSGGGGGAPMQAHAGFANFTFGGGGGAPMQPPAGPAYSSSGGGQNLFPPPPASTASTWGSAPGNPYPSAPPPGGRGTGKGMAAAAGRGGVLGDGGFGALGAGRGGAGWQPSGGFAPAPVGGAAAAAPQGDAPSGWKARIAWMQYRGEVTVLDEVSSVTTDGVDYGAGFVVSHKDAPTPMTVPEHAVYDRLNQPQVARAAGKKRSRDEEPPQPQQPQAAGAPLLVNLVGAGLGLIGAGIRFLAGGGGGQTYNLKSGTKLSGTKPCGAAFKVRVAESLGAGTFGTVYKITDPSVYADYAAKVFAPDGRTDIARACKVEYEQIHELNWLDPEKFFSIVRVHATGSHTHQDNGEVLPWFAMDYLGITLKDLQKYTNMDHLPELNLARLGLELASAVSFMHRHTFIHADIRVENVLFKRWFKKDPFGAKNLYSALLQGPGHEYTPEYVLVDFGAARKTDSETHRNQKVVCMVECRPPEVCHRLEWGPPVDVWCIGCVMAQAACKGMAPIFDAQGQIGIYEQISYLLGHRSQLYRQRTAANSSDFPDDPYPSAEREADRDDSRKSAMARADDYGRGVVERTVQLRRNPDLWEAITMMLHPAPALRIKPEQIGKMKFFDKWPAADTFKKKLSMVVEGYRTKPPSKPTPPAAAASAAAGSC
eukprot:TRINITY_DN1553_c0_g1_i1.p1 TRINITY_DN1553_c0_g1~~TRINITY_DN1553_c0_g1_i1.p1  ORF type:complete len:825 (+),score=183.93 TRINITY_DN1553_c0_g1_i1:117-2477(+)